MLHIGMSYMRENLIFLLWTKFSENQDISDYQLDANGQHHVP
jgi:hypothetical protein